MKAILYLLFPILSLQWWDVGHMLTAAIAQIRLKQLSPSTKNSFDTLVTSINNLVDNKSRTLIESACWPDDLKAKQYNMELWNDWHFIDKPHITDGVFAIINMTQTLLSSVQVVNNAIKVLSANINKTTAERALFARYLVHIVGDIHQPLHSVSMYNETFPSGDRGGNSLHVVLLNGTTQNLHAFWDAGAFRVQNDSWFINRPMDLQNTTNLRTVANSWISTYGSQVESLAQILDPNVWAKESFLFAQNVTYPAFLNSNKITEQYASQAFEVSKKRITLAGYRLANLVIDIYQKASSQVNLPTTMKEILQSVHLESGIIEKPIVSVE